jgi:hypothetical protein
VKTTENLIALSPELNTGLRGVVPACPFRQPYMVFLFVGSSALTCGFLPTKPRDSVSNEQLHLAVGDRVQNPERPKWGVGEVLDVDGLQ